MLSVAERVGKIFGQLSYKKQEQAKQTYGPYRALLESLADGSEVDVDEAEILLEQMGKTRSDLEHDVELLLKRRQWAAEVADEPAATSEMERWGDAAEKNDRELIGAQAKHERQRKEIRLAIDAAKQRLIRASYARDNLRDKILTPDAGRIEEIRIQLAELAPELVKWSQEESRARSKRDAYLGLTRRVVTGSLSDVEEKLRIAERDYEQAHGMLAPLLEQRDALQGELDRLHREALKP